MVTLTLTEKGGEPRQLTFDKDEVTVGRVQGNDIVLPKGNVSKRHCRLVVRDGEFTVEDMKSTNGTYVNGRKIAERTSVSGEDKIYVGDFIIRLEVPRAAISSVPAAEPGSLSSAIRRPPPPPPPPRSAPASLKVDTDEARSERSSARALPPPPPPPPRRDSRPLAPLAEEDETPPPPSDIDMDDEPLATEPPRLNVPPLKPVLPSAAEPGRSSDEEEPITAQRGKSVLPAPVSAVMTLAEYPPWLSRLLDKPDVTAVLISGNTVEVERGGQREAASAAPSNVEELIQVLRALSARGTPRPPGDAAAVSTAMPDGARLTALFPPTASQLCAAIHKSARAPRGLDELVESGALSSEMQQLLEACTTARRNVLVTGARAAAETVLSALASTIGTRNRVVVIADRVAIPTGSVSWTKLQAEPRSPDLLPAAVALRPDYLVVDLTSTMLAADLLAECALGQEGTLVALAARSATDALGRLQALAPALGATANLREIVASSVDLVVHAATLPDGTLRVLELSEPRLTGDGQLLAEPLLAWKPEPGSREPRAGRFAIVGGASRLATTLAARGAPVPDSVLRA